MYMHRLSNYSALRLIGTRLKDAVFPRWLQLNGVTKILRGYYYYTGSIIWGKFQLEVVALTKV